MIKFYIYFLLSIGLLILIPTKTSALELIDTESTFAQNNIKVLDVDHSSNNRTLLTWDSTVKNFEILQGFNSTFGDNGFESSDEMMGVFDSNLIVEDNYFKCETTVSQYVVATHYKPVDFNALNNKLHATQFAYYLSI